MSSYKDGLLCHSHVLTVFEDRTCYPELGQKISVFTLHYIMLGKLGLFFFFFFFSIIIINFNTWNKLSKGKLTL